MYHQTLLPNGTRVVTAEMPHMASTAVGVWVGAGGRHESAKLSGISHFIEHMLFKGTRRRSAAEISQAVEGVGGYLNAFTDEEHTCFYARAHGSRWGDLLAVLTDMFTNSRLTPGDIVRERAVILEEIAMYRDQPAELVHDVLNQLQFPRHPLGRPVIGSPSTLRGLGRNELRTHLASHYTSGATLIAAAGNLRHEDFVRESTPLAAQFRPGQRPDFERFERSPAGPAVRLVVRDVEQANLGLGLRAVSRHDPRRHALRLLNVILGENMSSRLFQVVREDHGLTYNIQSSATTWADVGDLVVSAGLDPSEVEKTLVLVIRELDRLMKRAPGMAELSRAKDYVLGQFELSMESTENHMMWLGEQWLNHGEFVPPSTIRERITRVTAPEISALARTLFTPDRRSLAIVSPRKQFSGLNRILES
jgi:predicted Zn-dependent peptidase